MSRRSNNGSFRFIGFMLLSSCLASCDKSPPLSNTPEYRVAHGIVEGQENTVLIGQSKFRLPPETIFDVYTSEEIRQHQADRLNLYINMARALNVDPAQAEVYRPHKLGKYIVRVEIKYRRSHSAENSIFFYEKPLGEPRVREDLKLIEYQLLAPSPTEYSEQYLYKAIEKSSVGLFPPYTEISCSVVRPNDEARRNGRCRMAYYVPGLVVQSFFSLDLLPEWQIILDKASRDVSRYAVQ